MTERRLASEVPAALSVVPAADHDALLAEKDAEIERLSEELRDASPGWLAADGKIVEKDAEIERLKAENEAMRRDEAIHRAALHAPTTDEKDAEIERLKYRRLAEHNIIFDWCRELGLGLMSPPRAPEAVDALGREIERLREVLDWISKDGMVGARARAAAKAVTDAC